jgi:hypothetical protein
MPTPNEYGSILDIIIALSNATSNEERMMLLELLANNGYYYGNGGPKMSGSAEVNTISANHNVTTDGGVLDVSGTAVVRRVYNDRKCNRTKFGCKITYPNKHQQCFEAGFYTATKRNIFPKSFASTGAYLPAITACTQYLYLPGQSEQDVRKGSYQPVR